VQEVPVADAAAEADTVWDDPAADTASAAEVPVADAVPEAAALEAADHSEAVWQEVPEGVHREADSEDLQADPAACEADSEARSADPAACEAVSEVRQEVSVI
jgi:hypothetical protein